VSALILVVDADNDGRAILKAYLQHHGYEVLETPDGEEALALARSHSPDLIIGEFPLNVPGHSPFTRAVRAESHYEGRILSVSARARPQEVAAAEAVSDAVMLKPVHPSEVLGEVRRLLGEE
jgi:DNA-binding response OmpR family regulator